MINTKGIPQGKVLAALYNRSQPLGMGMLHFDPKAMTEEQANAILGDSGRVDDIGLKVPNVTYFDYLKGRVMKVNLSNPNEFDERLYDRDNGPGAAQRAIDSIKAAA